MSTETRAAFARRIGVNKSTITRAAQAGRLVLTVDGLVQVEASLKRWNETKAGRTDVEARHAQNRGRVIPEAIQGEENATKAVSGATEAQPLEGGEGDVGEATWRTQYKAQAMDYENQAIRLEMDMRAGRRYPLEDARNEGHGLGATLRAAMERLIDQSAPRLAVVTDLTDRRRLLAAEIAKLRRLIKTDMPRTLRRLREISAGKRVGGGQ